MATEDEGTEGAGEESGKKLREKLEAALKENADFKSRLTTLEAQNLIREKGYKLITAEDLQLVGIEDLAKKAESLEVERAALGKNALRKTLEARGLTGDDLEETLTAILGESEGEASMQALDRIRAAGNVPGTKVADAEEPGLFGPSRINAALKAKKK